MINCLIVAALQQTSTIRSEDKLGKLLMNKVELLAAEAKCFYEEVVETKTESSGNQTRPWKKPDVALCVPGCKNDYFHYPLTWQLFSWSSDSLFHL